MSPDRWRQVSDLFDRVADLPSNERAAVLDREAIGQDGVTDGALREEVERLLVLDAAAPAEPAAAAPTPAPDAGPWTLHERVARGGMGEVWRASRPLSGDLRQMAAVKLVRPGLSADLDARARAEHRILAGLEHPAIARLLDAGTASDGRPYLATEFVHGEPITAFCDRRRLGVNERLALFVEVCEAVAYAHTRLVVHRDLKPSNVLVAGVSERSEDRGSGSEGESAHSPLPVLRPQVKLLDFGIAKLLEEDEALTRTGRPVLTPAYAAPEQRTGGDVTTATDVYGLGVLLYELLAGRRPDADDATRPSEAITTAATEAGRVPPGPDGPPTGDTGTLRSTTADRLRRRLRGDLDRICLKALRDDPARRYRGAAELGADVQRHLDGLPVEARPESVGYRLGKFVRRNRVAVAAAAVALLAVLGGAGVALASAAEADRQREAALAEVGNFADGLDAFAVAFQTGDPDQMGIDAQAAQAMLDRFRATADTMRNPRAQAALFGALSTIYLNRGQFATAESLATVAASVPVPAVPSVLGQRASHLTTLGTARLMLGRAEDGVEPLREAVALLEGPLGQRGSTMHAYALGELAKLMNGAGQTEEAIPLMTRAAEMARALDANPDPDHYTWLSSRAYADLGMMYYKLGRMQEALPMVERAYVISEEPGRGGGGKTVVDRQYAQVLNAVGDPQRAAEILTPSIERAVAQYGPDHYTVLGLRRIRAGAWKRMGDRRAISEMREVVAEARRIIDPTTGQMGVFLVSLASAEAMESSARALPIYEEAFALLGGEVTNVSTATAAAGLAAALAQTGDSDRARRLAREAAAAFREVGRDERADEVLASVRAPAP
ncbi:MAG: serine/threonine-protein kinase [Bacteroidota bacterium]